MTRFMLALLTTLLLASSVHAAEPPKLVGSCNFSGMGICDEFTTGDAAERKKACTSGFPSGKFKAEACPTKNEVARCAFTSGALAGQTRVFYSPNSDQKKAAQACDRSVATFTVTAKDAKAK